MLSSLFVVSVSRVWVSSTLLFFGSAKPCTDHSAVTLVALAGSVTSHYQCFTGTVPAYQGPSTTTY